MSPNSYQLVTKKLDEENELFQRYASKSRKKPNFHTYFAIFGQIRFFLKNRAQSIFRIHRDLTSCQKSEKINEPIFWKFPGRTDARTDGRKGVNLQDLTSKGGGSKNQKNSFTRKIFKSKKPRKWPKKGPKMAVFLPWRAEF